MAPNKVVKDLPGFSVELRGDGQFTDDDGRIVQYAKAVTINGGKVTRNGSYQMHPARFVQLIDELAKDKDFMAKLRELAKLP